jgi:hypothetical protein
VSWVLELRVAEKKGWRLLLVRPHQGVWQVPSSDLGIADSGEEFWNRYLGNYRDLRDPGHPAAYAALTKTPIGGYERRCAFVTKVAPNSYNGPIAQIRVYEAHQAAGLRTTELTRLILAQLMAEISIPRRP